MVLLPGETDYSTQIRPKVRVRDQLAVVVILAKAVAFTLIKIPIKHYPSIGWYEWLSWLKRYRREWLNCAAYRRHIIEAHFSNAFVICDAALFGGFLLEVADPRNPAGMDLLEFAVEGTRLLPRIDVDHVFAVGVGAEIAFQRESSRISNRVRPFLSHGGRVKFFQNAHLLTLELSRMLPAKGLGNAHFVTTENRSAPECCAQLVSVLKGRALDLAQRCANKIDNAR